MSNVLFKKGDQDDEDVWDDTALIKAYEKSVGLINKQLDEKGKTQTTSAVATSDQKRNALDEEMDEEEDVDEEDEVDAEDDEDLEEEYDESETNYKGYKLENLNLIKKKNLNEWKVGDLCIAVYSEDNLAYRAEITKIFEENQAKKCVVKYLFYSNEEEKFLNELYELNEQTFSKIPKESTSTDSTQNLPGFSNNQPFKAPQPIPPPPPPPALASLFQTEQSCKEDEDLYTMLMSWYMSGYHTGYYFGLKQAMKNSKK